MKLLNKIQPGLLVSESFFPLLADERRLMDALDAALEDGFYKRIEINAQKTTEGQRRLRNLAARLPVTQWITNDLNEGGLNPSSVDTLLRKKTVQKMLELVDVAAESGADRIAFISCADPGPDLRAEAAKGLAEVMTLVAEVAQKYGITLLLEPLDRGAHKNNFIGPTCEAVAILKKVHQTQKNVLLSWDSAHVALNGEDVVESLDQAFAYTGQIHLANAVLSRSSPAFGDWHMAMGSPGFLTEEKTQEILSAAAKRLAPGRTMGATVESRSHTEGEMADNLRRNRTFLENVLNREVE